MGTKQAYLGRLTLSSGALQFTVSDGTPAAITLTADEYYPVGYAGEGVGLVEHIQASIRSAGGVWATATCTLSLTTGLVTLDFGAITAITWTDTTLRDYLGWTADLSGSTSYTAPNACRFLWLPTESPSRYPVNLTEFWEFISSSTVKQGPDGGSHGRAGGSQFAADISYDLLPRAEVIIPSGGAQDGNKTFERFFKDVAHNTQPVRIVTDRETYAASTDYEVGLICNPDRESPLGRVRDWIDPSLGEEHDTEWDVDLHFAKYDGV